MRMKLAEIIEGLDDKWSNDTETITLQDILNLTKNVPVRDFPTKKLAPIVLNWDDNPDEISKIERSNLEYPILIMVDDNEKIKWILDGNHRAQKALKNKLPTIKAKLIKPSNLTNKARRILLHEARYVGANRYFCIMWETHGTALYDFGITDSKNGMYVGEPDIVSVANTAKESLEELQKFMFDYHAAENEGEQLHWQKSDYDRQARSYGGSLQQIEYSLPDDSTWEYYPPGDTLYSITELTRGPGR